MKALILAGGMGKRLRPLTDDKPKPMIPISDKPILEWQITWLKSHNIRDFVLCTGYLGDNIIEYFGNGEQLEVNIEYSKEDEPLGTGGALMQSRSLLESESSFLVMNGDIMTNIDPSSLIHNLNDDLLGTIAVVALRSPFGEIEIQDDGLISSFTEKPILDDHWINAGIYCFSNNIFNYLSDVGSLESDVFPILATENKLSAIKQNNVKWRSIDSHKDIEEAQKEFNS
ncbi:MAG: nucleotidyltransferase [Thaumarchaeota archaeon]|nr:nucleotidyltransferase [Nitrososphaerota archaeon]|tara:strand:+ start:4806 stop:5489 length:684 start_codon:yes stop_codon:yes gene_type:complete